jgi:DNA-binding SARP family transcriptional activator
VKRIEMMLVRICFDGGFSIYRGTELLHLSLRGCTREMLIYLLLHPNRDVRREKLASLFWQDRCEASARNLLSTALWRIRKVLSSIQGIELLTNAGTVRVSLTASVVSNATLLIEAVRNFDASSSSSLHYQHLLDAVGEEDAEFVDGISSDWAQIERERFTNLKVAALMLLMNYETEMHRCEQAIGFAKRILMIDPFRENIQRQLMWLYVQVGRPAHALRQYEKIQSQLLIELNLKPAAETTALYKLLQDEGNIQPLTQTCDDITSWRRQVYETLAALSH